MKRIFAVLAIMLMSGYVYSDMAWGKRVWSVNPLPPGDEHGAFIGDEGEIEVSSLTFRGQIKNLISKCDTWQDLPAASTFSVFSRLISTTTLSLGTTSFSPTDSFFTQIRYPTCVGAAYDTYFASNIAYGNVTIRGRDARGNSITNTVLSTGSAVMYFSSNAFSIIDLISPAAIATPTNSLDVGNGKGVDGANIRLNISMSNRIGFMGDLNLTTDYYKLTANYVDITGSCTVNNTYDWWSPAQKPDGANDYHLYYILGTR